MSEVKQVIVVRMDITMGKGKFGAQVAHASLAVFTKKATFHRGYKEWSDGVHMHARMDGSAKGMFVPMGDDELEWTQGIFTKILLGVRTEAELLEAYRLADEAGLPCVLITDAGKTQFKKACPDCDGTGEVHPVPAAMRDGFPPTDCSTCEGTGKVGVPTNTCIAIGPARSEDINKITGPKGAVKTRLL